MLVNRLFLLVFPMLFAASPVKSQDSIQFIREWKLGEQKKFTFTRLRSDYTRDTLYSTSSFVYDVSMTVTQVEANGIEITWAYTNKNKDFKVFKKSPNDYILTNAMDQLTRELYGFKSLKVVYTIDPSGGFATLKNAVEVKQYIKGVLSAAQQNSRTPADFKKVYQQFTTAFLSDDYVTYTFLSELQSYHQVYGVTWGMGKEVYSTELANPLSGEPLPGTLTTTVEKKENVDAFNVLMIQEVDNKKLSSVVNDRMEDAYEKLDKPVSQNALLEFSIRYQYSLINARIEEMRYTKTASSGPTKVVEILTFEPWQP